eukprot:TRINITY_DN8155_c1_g1_i2.p1 TRINITY_DN8155_c1_g1~~TRINITY_DN8155_c1_g1_i2.p1  ORF type:complete len:212 (+),score=47.52 TRINITY_DN8155_c1_g1_i2:71-637(+)
MMMDLTVKKKVLIVGKSGVGKTTLVENFCYGGRVTKERNHIHKAHRVLVPFSVLTMDYIIFDGASDSTAPLRKKSNHFDAVVFVYSTDDRLSFEFVQETLELFKEAQGQHICNLGLIVANKTSKKKSCVSRREARLLAQKNGVGFVSCNAANPHEASVPFTSLNKAFKKDAFDFAKGGRAFKSFCSIL